MLRRRRVFYDKPLIRSYGNWVISISSSSNTIANSGGSITLTPTAVRDVYWSNGDVTQEEGVPVLSSPSRGTLTGNTLTVDANHTTNEIDITIVGKIDSVASTLKVATQDKNRISYVEYGTPIFTSSSYSNIDAKGGTVTPVVSYKQSRVQHWESSNSYTTSMSDIVVSQDDNTISYSGLATGASLNSSTGVITWNPNETESTRSIEVTISINSNGKTTSTKVIAKQTGDVITGYTYDVPVVTFNDYGTKNSSAGSIGVSAVPTYKQVRTNHWLSGKTTTTNLTTGGTITYSGSTQGASVDKNNGTVTWEAYTNTTIDRSIVVTASVTMNDKTGVDTAVSVQNHDVINTYDYSDVVVTLNNYNTVDAKNQSVTPSYSYKQVRTNNWVSGNVTTTDLTTGGTLKWSISGAATINNGTITWPAQSGNTVDRTSTITLEVTMNGERTYVLTREEQGKDYIGLRSLNKAPSVKIVANKDTKITDLKATVYMF